MDCSTLSSNISEIYKNFALANKHLEKWETLDELFRTLNNNYFSKSALEQTLKIRFKYEHPQLEAV